MLLESTSLVQQSLIVNAYHHLEAICKQKKIPNLFVSQEVVYSALRKLEYELRGYGRELAIPLSMIDDYFKMNIAECLVDSDHLLVKLQVPIVTKGKDWEFLKLSSIDKAHYNETCKLTLPTSMIAKSRTDIVIFDNVDLLACNYLHSGLCLIPKNHAIKYQYTACIEAILSDNTVHDLHKVCQYDCIQDRKLRITRLMGSQFSITHMPKTENTLNCQGIITKIVDAPPDVGNWEYSVQCGCDLLHNDTVVVGSPFPCPRTDGILHRFIHTVPSQWVNIGSLVVKAAS